MRVIIKDFAVNMELGNNGITFDVYDGDTHLGDIRIGRGTIEWCRGKAHSGHKIGWPQLIELIEANGKK
jgi:hypothetical protein